MFYYLYDGLESEGRWRKFYLDEQLKSRHRYLQPLSIAHREHNVHRWRQLNQAFKVTQNILQVLVLNLHRHRHYNAILTKAIIPKFELQFGEPLHKDDQIHTAIRILI